MANAIEQALLLPGDMADLRALRKHEVFLSLKRDLALVISLTELFLSLFLLLLLLFYFIVIIIYYNNYTCSFQHLHFFS